MGAGVRHEQSVEIAAPAAVVFVWATDPFCLPHWTPNLVRASVRGELGLGTTIDAVYRFFGIPVEALSVVTEYMPGRRFEVSAEVLGVKTVQALTLEPLGPRRTRLTVTTETQLRAVERLVVRLTRRFDDARLARGLAALTRLAERDAARIASLAE